VIDYFDASAVVAVLLDEPARHRVNAHLAAADSAPLVSDFAVAEVSSAISRLLRMKLKTAAEGEMLIGSLDQWVGETGGAVSLDALDAREATLLVRRFDLNLRAPDALHLAICRRLQARLVTLDNTLTAAARALDVPCINPAETSAL
jgi:predicted nucleic acid-binding protein